MSEADPRPRRRSSAPLPLPETVALVLQGGGALGSFQAGIYEALATVDIPIDWVAGISIGAVNAALIAGNPPERRVAALTEFWGLLTSGLPSFPIPWVPDRVREMMNEMSAGIVATGGVPGFFRPRVVPPTFAVPGTIEALSFYDSSQLASTLDRFVDWELLNTGPVRLAVGAVEIMSGNFEYFDTTRQRIDARHIMASGALPPGLPPIEIDGKWYWDGGLVSNTPLAHVLANQKTDLLVFQVDLFASADVMPKTITDVMARQKEIQYSSRTRMVSDMLLKLRADHASIRRLLAKLPAEMKDDPDVVALGQRAQDKAVSLVQLIYRANAWEGGSRDYEFSERTMHDHWAAGRLAVERTIDKAGLIATNIVDGKTAAFDLGNHHAQ